MGGLRNLSGLDASQLVIDGDLKISGNNNLESIADLNGVVITGTCMIANNPLCVGCTCGSIGLAAFTTSTTTTSTTSTTTVTTTTSTSTTSTTTRNPAYEGDVLCQSSAQLADAAALLEDRLRINGMVAFSNYDSFTCDVDATTLASMTAISHVEALEIRGSTALETLAGLEALAAVEFDVAIRGNAALSNLSGLDTLSSIGLDLTIRGNALLTSLSGLSSLTHVGGQLAIQSNPVLETLDFMTSLGSVDFLLISNNPLLTEVDALASLTSVNTLYVFGNDELANVNALRNVTIVGDCFISGLKDCVSPDACSCSDL
ncbi:uncharacterized protein MONBRDRAFT_5103 [Monosiga brevicollis MX1]|uniref:Receptor L-domain domain-containing protein n=1 Tax=Monosiga brevicollis TaxID=81824 RepID=A9UPX9_MONBE|nr:uncharacterized protein MONBRDRAFT_5103 [Monosiga brevicollis MX1]EDQ92498.1 predicted protein [Monosiga brevicollis MX1]|eukprot:XP_001742260.1 hypothetical protein [Monosiga brevicollis MX1]